MSAPVPDHAALPVAELRRRLAAPVCPFCGNRPDHHHTDCYACLKCGAEVDVAGLCAKCRGERERDWRWFMGRDTP